MREYLPIGTVVVLRGGEKAIMVYGRKQVHLETNELFDYIACLYPEGNLSPEFTYLFNHEDIAKILFTGYKSREETSFLELLLKMEAEFEDNELATKNEVEISEYSSNIEESSSKTNTSLFEG